MEGVWLYEEKKKRMDGDGFLIERNDELRGVGVKQKWYIVWPS